MLPEVDEIMLATTLPLPKEEWLCSLHLFKGQYYVSYKQGDRLVRKAVSPATVREAFVQIPIDSGYIPKKVVRWGIDGSSQWVAMFIPPTMQTLNISDAGGKVLVVPLPAMLFIGKGQTYYVLALEDEEFSPSKRLYHAPLPNVHAESRICYGSVAVPTTSLTTIDRAWTLFITSNFNRDLTHGKSKQHPNSAIEMLEHLAKTKATRYPTDDLVEFSRPNRQLQLTVDDLLNSVAKV